VTSIRIIKGNYNTAKVFTDDVESKTLDQIKNLLNNEAFSGLKIRIMPDCHAGAGCVIGFTAELGDKVVPNLVGVDIGCGIKAYCIGNTEIDFSQLDKFIRNNIPHGFNHNKKVDKGIDRKLSERIEKNCKKMNLDTFEQLSGIGSLGGGNHFIEVSQDSQGHKWILIHSGSRNFGLQTANYHQKKAKKHCQGKKIEIQASLAYLEGDAREEYLEDMKIAQEYAALNREIMIDRIIKAFSLKITDRIESVHNYIDFSDRILRKGAIAAYSGIPLVIPMNMKFGSVIGYGRSVADWNFSAPHGAGRVMSRSQAKKKLKLEDFRQTMKGVWTSTVSRGTIDEAPQVYKNPERIIESISETVDINDILKPLYNFKG